MEVWESLKKEFEGIEKIMKEFDKKYLEVRFGGVEQIDERILGETPSLERNEGRTFWIEYGCKIYGAKKGKVKELEPEEIIYHNGNLDYEKDGESIFANINDFDYFVAIEYDNSDERNRKIEMPEMIIYKKGNKLEKSVKKYERKIAVESTVGNKINYPHKHNPGDILKIETKGWIIKDDEIIEIENSTLKTMQKYEIEECTAVVKISPNYTTGLGAVKSDDYHVWEIVPNKFKVEEWCNEGLLNEEVITGYKRSQPKMYDYVGSIITLDGIVRQTQYPSFIIKEI